MRLISIKEFARDQGLSCWQLYDLIKRKEIPAGVAVRLGRRLFFEEEALKQWLRAGGTGLTHDGKRQAAGD